MFGAGRWFGPIVWFVPIVSGPAKAINSGIQMSERLPRCIGLVGGMGPGATVHYYRELVRTHALRGVRPNLVIVNADNKVVLDFVTRGAVTELAEYLAGLIERLKRAGAEFAVIPAVTPHVCVQELGERSALPLLDIFEPTREALRRVGSRRVALFGTRFSVESDAFGQLSEFEVVRPRADEVARVHQIYLDVVETGALAVRQAKELGLIAKRLVREEGVDMILIAGTDFSEWMPPSQLDFPALDFAGLQIQSVTEAALAD